MKPYMSYKNQWCRDTTYPSCSKSHMAITADNTFKILRIMKRTLNLAIEQQNHGGCRCEATHIFARVTSLSNKPVFWALEAAGISTSNFGSRITDPAWIKHNNKNFKKTNVIQII